MSAAATWQSAGQMAAARPVDGNALQYRAIHNLEAEAALIAAMLQENQIIDHAADALAPEDFAEPLFQRMFAAIVAQFTQGKAVNPVTLRPLFEKDDALAALGGASFLARLTADTFGLMAWKDLIAQVGHLAKLRRMQLGLITAAEACSDAMASPDSYDDAIKEIVQHADAALDITGGDPIVQVSAAEAVDGLLQTFKTEIRGVRCNAMPELDRVLGPIAPKDLVILAGRPGMGKTAVAVSYAVGAARAGKGVLFVSLEMSKDQIGGRILCDWCFTHGDNSIPYSAITDGQLNEWQQSRAAGACGAMVQAPLQIIDTGQLTLGRLNSLVKRWKRRFAARGETLDLVIVDYLQLMRAGPRGLSKYEDVSEVSNGLKRIAKDHEVSLMALCQLSREVEKRQDKRPILADLRDSGSIEQDADSVIFLMREEYYLEQTRPAETSPKLFDWQANMDDVAGRIEFIAAKRRNGRTGKGVGTFHAEYQAVR